MHAPRTGIWQIEGGKIQTLGRAISHLVRSGMNRYQVVA
jgi:hypothetical protein